MPPISRIAAVAMAISMTVTVMASNVAAGVGTTAASTGALGNQEAKQHDHRDDENDIERRPHSWRPFRLARPFWRAQIRVGLGKSADSPDAVRALITTSSRERNKRTGSASARCQRSLGPAEPRASRSNMAARGFAFVAAPARTALTTIAEEK